MIYFRKNVCGQRWTIYGSYFSVILCSATSPLKDRNQIRRNTVPHDYHLVFFSLKPQAPQAHNTWSLRQLVYIENSMGKSPIVKRLCK